MNTKEIVTAILAARAISPDAANTLIGTVAKTPAMFTALLSDLTDEDRGAIVSAIVAGPRWNVTQTKPADTAATVEGAVPGSIRDKILTYLKDHPKSDAGAIRTAIGAATGGGFAAALKVGIDKGQIVCHEPTQESAVKTYSLAPAGK